MQTEMFSGLSSTSLLSNCELPLFTVLLITSIIVAGCVCRILWKAMDCRTETGVVQEVIFVLVGQLIVVNSYVSS